jgi:predicted secreted protein
MKRTIMRKLIIIALILLFPASPWVQDYKTLLDIPEGATLFDLSATERVEVKQDLLTATLRYEAENSNSRSLQSEVNSHMKEALDIAKNFETVKTSTQG